MSWSHTCTIGRSAFKAHAPISISLKQHQQVTSDFYNLQSQLHAKKPVWVTHDGPPYANGSIHLGHALNKVLKDIQNRYRVSKGYRVVYKPGFDCHGLPIEHRALRERKTKGPLTALQTRELARAMAESQIAIQTSQFKALGIMADWSAGSTYRTMDAAFEHAQLKLFADLFQKGLISRRFRPVYWSPSSKTALAEAELEYMEMKSPSVYVKFRVVGMSGRVKDIVKDKPLHLLIWTTTPWTLPANEAVAVSKEAIYVLAWSSKLKSYVALAEQLVRRVDEKVGLDLSSDHTKITGADLLDCVYVSPLATQIKRRIISSPHVTEDAGTGLVHTAPAHGMVDYGVMAALGHQVTSLINSELTYGPSLKQVVDVSVYEKLHMASVDPRTGQNLAPDQMQSAADEAVMACLMESDHLVHSEIYSHRVPIDWRTKQPVIVISTHQWFMDIRTTKERALQELDKVEIIPSNTSLANALASRAEWCISRQRPWGVPIPILFEKIDDSLHPILDLSTIQYTIARLAEWGTDAWWYRPASDFAPFKDLRELVKGTDTLDVWFDSGSSWTDMLRDGHAQADLYCEGTDQHRGWFQSSLITSTASRGISPYKALVTHGFVLDAQGRKMSKSLGNVVSPEDLLKSKDSENDSNLPMEATEALRCWIATQDSGTDVRFSQDSYQTAQNLLKDLRRTLSFLIGNLHYTSGLQSEVSLSNDKSAMLDHWILHELNTLSSECDDAYAAFASHKVIIALSEFVNTNLSRIYFERIKDCLYCDPNTSRKLSIYCTIKHIYHSICCMINPILPYSILEANSEFSISGQQITAWPVHPRVDKGLVKSTQELLELWKHVAKAYELARDAGTIKGSQDATVTVWHSPLKSLLNEFQPQLANLLLAQEVVIAHAPLDAPIYCHGTLQISISKSQGPRCPRCRLHTVNHFDDLCSRCISAVNL